jgi:thiol-disulfide isomerase/thioredoxin
LWLLESRDYNTQIFNLSFYKGFHMKNFILIMVVAIWGMTSFSANAQDEMLLGVISKADLQQTPYAAWYTENDQNYQVDSAALSGLDELLSGVEIKIVMGTWCHDSQREVPRLYKILSSYNADTEMIALDRKKQAPGNEIDDMGITNTPTFIFYKDGVELNRIVEVPVESLEKDMIKILQKSPYKHSKMPGGE